MSKSTNKTSAAIERLMKFDVKNRYSGDIQFTADIDCEEDASVSVMRGLAVAWAIENKADLSEADLNGAYLLGADLSGTDLNGASLYNADLRGADLRGANLNGADLRGANLNVADLRGTPLYNADLRGADLNGTNLNGADLREANLNGTNLGMASLYNADLRGADLRGANLYEANLYEAKLYTVKGILRIGPSLTGREWFVTIRDGEPWIQAGCHYFTLKEARKFWRETRPDGPIGKERQAFCDLIEAWAKGQRDE